jgi:uncharacterized membrane protein
VSGFVYDTVEVLHVISAVVAFGSLAATGWYSGRLRQLADPFSDQSLHRYFRPGRNLAELAIFAVPAFGGALVGIAGRAVADHPWPWIGLAIWLVAASVAAAVVWPAERALQEALATPEKALAPVRRLAKRAERGAAATSLCFVAALVVMVWQP